MHRIDNIHLPTPLTAGESFSWSIFLDHDDIVRLVRPMPINSSIDEEVENWNGDWLSPMAVDIQFNGGLGLAFNDLRFEDSSKIYKLLDKLWMQGVEAICPTLVTCSVKSLRNSLEVLHLLRKRKIEKSCRLLGAHLEGPFLSMNHYGAHDKNHLVNPTPFELKKRISGYENEIAVMTLAPELPRSLEMIKILLDIDVVISLGHSSADSEISAIAFDEGVSMITHAFNAMPGIHHRSPGPLVEAIDNGNIFIGLIADGIHVHSKIIKILQKLSPGKIFLVSDALSPYGLITKESMWDERLLIVDQGICRLQDSTLAGTTVPLLDACQRMALWTKNSSASIWAATVAPRLALREGNNIEDFLVGKPLSHLLRWKYSESSQELNWVHAK